MSGFGVRFSTRPQLFTSQLRILVVSIADDVPDEGGGGILFISLHREGEKENLGAEPKDLTQTTEGQNFDADPGPGPWGQNSLLLGAQQEEGSDLPGAVDQGNVRVTEVADGGALGNSGSPRIRLGGGNSFHLLIFF